MQNKTKMETFNDGEAAICLIDDNGNAGTVKETLRFRERTVGWKRYYESMTAKLQVDRVIRILYRPWLTTEYLLVINAEVYEIRQVQIMTDTLPKTNDISIHLARQRRVADGEL